MEYQKCKKYPTEIALSNEQGVCSLCEGDCLENQPQHTQGEWVQNGVNGIHTKEGNCIAVTYGIGYGKDVRKANAQRIVKAVNVLSEIEKNLEWMNKTGGAISENEKLIKREYLLLLKRAEQK